MAPSASSTGGSNVRRSLLVALVVTCILSGGCANTASPTPRPAVTGAARSAYGGAYPVGSRLILRIVDPLSSSSIPFAGVERDIVPGWEIAGTNRTIAFSVPYEPSRIERQRPYVLRAEVVDPDGRLIAVSDEAAPVVTAGAPVSGVELTLVSPNETTSSPPAP